MASSIPDEVAENVAENVAGMQDTPAADTGVAKAGLFSLPQKLYDAIFREYFKDTVLVYQNDGQHASLKPVLGGSEHALAILLTCKKLYQKAMPLLPVHATVIVHCTRRNFSRDMELRGSPFWNYTRRFRSLHAHGVGASPALMARSLQSTFYWSEAYLLRDLVCMWPNTEVFTLGGITILSNISMPFRTGHAASQELVFQELVRACRASKFTFHSTIIHALRQHGIGQHVKFWIRFRIQVSVRCEFDGGYVERDICVSATTPASPYARPTPSAQSEQVGGWFTLD